MLVYDYKSGIRDLREKIGEMEEEVTAENFFWAKEKVQEVLERVEWLNNLQKKEQLIERLIRWSKDSLPLTPKGYNEWRERYSIKELNKIFEGIFEFKNMSCGGGRAVWYFNIGMSIDDASDAANCRLSDLHHQPGERILWKEFSPGDAWYGDITKSTRVRILSSQTEIWDKIGEILLKEGEKRIEIRE